MVLNRRHWVKAITWRLLGTSVTIAITISVTGSVETGFLVGPLDFVIKVLLYYAHEKVWLLSKFGVRSTSVIENKS